jgi:methyl-accepting chemotaxis protein
MRITTADMASSAATLRPRFARRTLMVNRSLQVKYGLIGLGLFSMAAFLVWWEFYNGFHSVLQQGLISSHNAVPVFDALGRLLLIKVLIALTLVWSLSIVLSHYLAGPIYRLESSLKLLKAGDLVHRVHLREKDELKDLASAYNEAIASLQSRIEADRDVIRDVISRLETVALTEASESTAAKVQAAANKLKDLTSGFSV